jgi:hypothetical protein
MKVNPREDNTIQKIADFVSISLTDAMNICRATEETVAPLTMPAAPTTPFLATYDNNNSNSARHLTMQDLGFPPSDDEWRITWTSRVSTWRTLIPIPKMRTCWMIRREPGNAT